MTISADSFSGDWSTGGQVVARGHVSITRQDTSIHAEEITYSLTSGEIQAKGQVVFQDVNGTLSASELMYNLNTGASSGADLEARIDEFSLRAARFQVLPGAVPGQPSTILAMDGAITSCTFDHPDYLLTAREIRLARGKGLSVRGAGVSLFGLRLITLPHLSLSLRRSNREGSRPPLLPSIGVSSAAGPFIRFSTSANLRRDTRGTAEIELSRKLGIAGGLILNRVADVPIGLTLYHREPAPKLNYPNLTIDRLPEIRKPIQESRRVGAGFVSLVGDITIGHYREYGTNLSGGRLRGRSALVWSAAPGPSHALAGVGFSDAAYSGHNYSVAGLEMGYQSRLTPELIGRLLLMGNTIRGRTPFTFDRVEAPRTVELAVDSSNEALGWSVDATYDPHARRLYELQVSLAHTLKCIRPSVGYRLRSRQILVGLTIPALEEMRTRLRGGRATAPAASPTYTWDEGSGIPIERR